MYILHCSWKLHKYYQETPRSGVKSFQQKIKSCKLSKNLQSFSPIWCRHPSIWCKSSFPRGRGRHPSVSHRVEDLLEIPQSVRRHILLQHTVKVRILHQQLQSHLGVDTRFQASVLKNMKLVLSYPYSLYLSM